MGVDILLGRNAYKWIYVPPLPVLLIVMLTLLFLLIILGIYLEIRRRKKKAAMERYAIKRMRRKFKGVQRGGKRGRGKKKKGKGKKGKKKDDGEAKPDDEWREYYD